MPKLDTERGTSPTHRTRTHCDAPARDDLQHFRRESAGWKLSALIVSKLPDIIRECRALAPVLGSVVTAYVLATQVLPRLTGL